MGVNSLANTVRQSRSNVQPVALSSGMHSETQQMPMNMINTPSLRHHTRLVPSELVFSAKQRNSKLELQNFKVNQE